MNLDITWIITTVIAVSSFLSPICVARINNKHQRKLRKLEIEHDMALKKLTVFYEDKKNAFSDFLYSAGLVCTDEQSQDEELKFYARSQLAVLFATTENQNLISRFTDEIMEYLDVGIPPEKYIYLKHQVSIIAASLNSELADLQTEIANYENCV